MAENEKRRSWLGALIGWATLGPVGGLAGWYFGAQVFDALLPQIEAGLKHYSELSPQQKAELGQALIRMQSQYSQMNALSRARYETRVGAIQHMAASNGIDWRP